MKVLKNKIKIDIILQKILLVAFIIGIFVLLIFAAVSIYFMAPVEPASEIDVEFTVKEGWTKKTIAHELEGAKLIKNAFFFQVYMRLNEKEMYAGTYKLSRNMSVDEIIRVLNSNNSAENETLTITFIEGKRLTDYVKKISLNFPYDEEEILAKLSDEDYLRSLIDQYWFIKDAILEKEIYYPLEGYLFPDTYVIRKNATIEEIIGKMLSTMDAKLSIYQEEITTGNYNIHELLTLSSVVELEGANSDDRAGVAGGFYNRLQTSMTLGSDVTTYYAAKKDFSVDLTYKDLNDCNAYNTRGSCVPGLPIGPIASPSLASITAVIEPAEHEWYFFVADKNKKTYFNKTNPEHNAKIAELKRDGLWYEY